MSAQYQKLCAERRQFQRVTGIREDNDCTVVAVALLAEIPYAEAHCALLKAGREYRRGFHWNACLDVLHVNYGMHYTVFVPDPSCKTIISTERWLAKYQRGRKFALLTSNWRHVLAFNGVRIADWSAGRRHRVDTIYRVERAA